jgi:anti-anti-sigma factor
MRMNMELTVEEFDSVKIISMTGDFDISNNYEVTSVIDDIISSGEKSIILNFENTDFIDSTAIGIIVDTTKKLRKLGGDLILLKVNDSIKGLFRIADLITILSFADEKSEISGMLKDI